MYVQRLASPHHVCSQHDSRMCNKWKACIVTERVVSPSLFSSVMYPPWRETGACNGAGDRPHEDPRSHLMLVATVNAAPAWVAYSYNIQHVQRPWVIAMSRSAANVDVWHCCCCSSVCVHAL